MRPYLIIQDECSSITQQMWDEIERSVAIPTKYHHIGTKTRKGQENFMSNYSTRQLTEGKKC